MTTKWEYRYERWSFLTEDSFPAEERGANVRSSSEEHRFFESDGWTRLGKQGWELVSVLKAPLNLKYTYLAKHEEFQKDEIIGYFKRPLLEGE